MIHHELQLFLSFAAKNFFSLFLTFPCHMNITDNSLSGPDYLVLMQKMLRPYDFKCNAINHKMQKINNSESETLALAADYQQHLKCTLPGLTPRIL